MPRRENPSAAPARRSPDGRDADASERRLLAEFQRHDTVASLAVEIAKRLGDDGRAKDLIADADLAQSLRGRLRAPQRN